ncbi:MAG: LysR substrate-binding domain-containing protein [Alphaproteobacteria bacterium]
MPVNLPTELLRSFTAIVESGSMLRAVDRVFLTQSALSLQMKRLEDILQTSLFHRDGRRLTLTPAGEALLSYSHDILSLNDEAVRALNGDVLVGPARVGFVQDFAETLLSNVLGGFAQLHPETQLQIRVAGSPELNAQLESDRLDLILCMGAENDEAGIHNEPMTWFGGAALAKQETLPLALLEPPCRFRDAILATLEKAGRPFRIVLETHSLSALRAGVEAGLCVTCRTPILMDKTMALPAELMPALPAVSYVLISRANPHPTIKKLGELVRTAALAL